MKTKKRILTFILTLCMVLSCFTGFHASETAVQAATDREEIYVTTITVDKGRVKYDGKTFWYEAKTAGRFLIKYNFNKKCDPETEIWYSESLGSGFSGREDALVDAKSVKKGAIKTPIYEKGVRGVNIGHSEKTDNNFYIDALSDKSVSGTVKIYFIPTCDTLSINTTELGLFEGQNSTLSVTAGPSKYTKNFGTTKWSSSKPDVVKVDKNGKITALKKGKATITAQVDSKKAKCVVTVYKKQESSDSIVATSMSLSKTTYSYDGKAKTPKVTVYDQNGEKVSSKYYTVSYANNKNAGTATVSVQVNPTTVGDTTIEGAFLSETFTIKPLKTSKVTLSKTSYTYKYKKNGFRPKVTVYDSKGKKISSKEYTVTYKNNNQGGTAKVIVQMNQNYGSKKFTKTFTIKYDEKTNKLLPKDKIISKYDGKVTDVLYYSDYLSADDLKKLLPYGDADVEFDELYNTAPFLNEKAFFPNMKNGDKSRESYAEFKENVLAKLGSKYTSIPFTGKLSDLFKCVVHSPVKEVIVNQSSPNNICIRCENGTKYNIRYVKWAGMQYSKYTGVEIVDYNSSYLEYHAIINVDFINYGYE